MLTHALSLPWRIAPGEVPATSEKWGFLGVLVCARGDSLAENRAMSTDRFLRILEKTIIVHFIKQNILTEFSQHNYHYVFFFFSINTKHILPYSLEGSKCAHSKVFGL